MYDWRGVTYAAPVRFCDLAKVFLSYERAGTTAELLSYPVGETT